jgi:acetyl esterase/lipase
MTLTVPKGLDPELARPAMFQPDLDYSRPQEARAALDRAYKISTVMRSKTDQIADPNDPNDPTTLVVTDRLVPARTGSPALLFFHGGGFVTGGLETEDARCRQIARRTGILVISVDYRLAPEHPFPCAFEDCHDVARWTAAHAAEIGVDAARIAVGGTSAGGALTAAVAMAVRDLGGPRLIYQLMLYPVIDHTMTTPSMKEFVTTPGWHQRNNVHMWRHYLGTEAPESVSPYAAPAAADDLSGLPPAYIMTAEYDPLRDEGLDFARRLLAAGVSVEIHHFPGTFHGFDAAAPEATVTRRALDEQCAVLARATGGSIRR